MEITYVKIGYLPLTLSLPIFVAQENGYFKDMGLNVTLSNVQDSSQLAQAVARGDFGGGGFSSVSDVFAIEQRQHGTLVIIGENVASIDNPFSAVLIRNDSSVTILGDLAGKKIALFPGPTSLMLSTVAFKHLTSDNFSFQPQQMPPPLMLEALVSKQVDAAVGYEPFNTLAKQKGLAKVLYPAFYENGVMNNLPGAVMVLSANLVHDNPTAAAKIDHAISKAIMFIKTNNTEARQIMVKYIPIDNSVAMNASISTWYDSSNIDVKNLQLYADLLSSSGGLQGHVNVTSTIYEGSK